MKRKITLVTMSQGNPIALKETFKSFDGVVDEIVYGDLCLFEDDRELIESYKSEFNLKIVKYPFNFIFKHGFSEILNSIISHSSNDMCIYMNCSEVIESGKENINRTVDYNEGCNVFYFDHATDHHRWFRMGDRRQLRWGGIIHESMGDPEDFRPYHKPLFRMADLPKDNDNKLKAKAYDICKEIVYFENYRKLVDDNSLLGYTDSGWIKFASENYQSFIDRMNDKGDFYNAFLLDNIELIYDYLLWDESGREKFKSSEILEYQNDKKYLL